MSQRLPILEVGPNLLSLSLWDGLASGEGTRIMVLGATNRPADIDSAILRRMPKRFPVKLPDFEQRRKILELVRRTTVDFGFTLITAVPADARVNTTRPLSDSGCSLPENQRSFWL